MTMAEVPVPSGTSLNYRQSTKIIGKNTFDEQQLRIRILVVQIYDCFTFFNEIDRLEIRLNELSSVVDTFVIAESPLTFQGKPKPLHFQDNIGRFERFAKQIRHIIVDDMPATDDPWAREFHQRNSLKLGMRDAAADAMVIISDADEIPTPSAILELKNRQDFAYLQMKLFVYFLNCEVVEGRGVPWIKAYAAPWQQIQTMPNLSAPRIERPDDYTTSHEIGELTDHIITNGGWHFSWLGSPENIIEKLDSFSHTEDCFKLWRDSEFLADYIARRRFFTTDACLSTRPIQEMPLTVQNAHERYRKNAMLDVA